MDNKKEYFRKYYLKNKKRHRELGAKWRLNNREKYKENNKRYYELNKEKIKARSKAWYHENKRKKEERLNRKREYNRQHAKNNRGQKNANKMAYLTAKIHRTPKWADLKAIEKFYKNCPWGHHVDHIVPLRGKNVSGLHVLENLQYLPARENSKKGNKF